MRRLSCVALAAAGVALVACVTPSTTPETKAVFARSSRSVHPERAPIPWEVGQWVLFRTSEAKSESIFRLFGYPETPLGFRRVGITGREGTAYWLDCHEVAGGHDLRMALLVDGFDPAHPDRLRLLRIRIAEPGGRIVEVSPDAEEARDVRARADALLAGLRFLGHRGRARTIIVPAGTFEATNAVPLSFSTTLGTSSGYVMYTNAVPVLYYAKRVTRRTSAIWFSEVETVELVDFGLSGARGSLVP